MATVPLPDGSAVQVRDGETPLDAYHRAQRMYPEAFGREPNHGGIGAFKNALKEYVADSAAGLGEIPGGEGLKNWATEFAKPSNDVGAWTPTTDKDKGFGAFINQKIVEPVMGMAGSYAVPMAGAALASAGAGAATMGPGALVAGPTAFTALAAPAELARNRRAVDEENAKRLESGQMPEETSMATSVAAAIVQGALGGLGGPIAKLTPKLLSMAGPEIASLTKQVITGTITKEAATASLNSTLRNYAGATAGAALGGTEMMVESDAIRRAQAGQDVMSPEALSSYAEEAGTAGFLAPILGLHGLPKRGKDVKAVEAAGKNWDKAADIASDFDTREQAAQKLTDYQAAQAQFRAQQAQDRNQGPTQQNDMPAMQGDLGLQGKWTARGVQDKIGPPPDKMPALSPEIRQMQQDIRTMQLDPTVDPKDIANKQAELDATLYAQSNPAAPAVKSKIQPITRKLLEQTIGLEKEKGTDGRALSDQFVGKDLRDPAVAQALNEALMAHGTMLNEQGRKPKTQSKIESFVNDSTARLQEEKLADSGQWQQGSLADSIDMSTTRSMRAADKLQARTEAWRKQQEEARVQAEAARAAAAERSNQAIAGGKTQDMFSGETTARDMRKPELPDPNSEELTKREQADAFDQHNDRMYKMFLDAHDHYNRTGDDALLKAVLADAKNGPMGKYQAVQDAASTRAMFDKNGRPTQGAKQDGTRPKPVEPVQPDTKPVNPAGGGSDGVPLSGSGGVRVHDPVDPVRTAVEPSAPVDAVPPVAAGNVKPPVKQNASQVRTANKITETAKRRWNADADKDGSVIERFEDMHPEAQEAVKKQSMRQLKGEDTFEPEFINRVMEKHVDAIARDNATRSARSGPKGSGVGKEEAQAHIDHLVKDWTNKPKITAVDFKDLSNAEKQWVLQNNAKAYIDEKGIKVLHERHADLSDVGASVFHETLGHHGLRSAFKEKLTAMLDSMYDTNESVREAADKLRQKGMTKAQAVEEVLAEGQNAFDPALKRSLKDQIVQLVRQFARKMGMSLNWTSKDIEAVMRQARKEVEVGKPTEAAGSRAARVFSKSVPKDATIMLEHADGKEHEHNARQAMRKAEQHKNVMDMLKECLGA